jgi:cob(I)alamin adenosyltransferase
MVTLNRIYTRTGDGGKTRLSTGAPVAKTHPRVEAYGAVDELNAQIGWARTTLAAEPVLDAMLARVQNDLFDLGADLATPEGTRATEDLRMLDSQVARLEGEIDQLNDQLEPLTSFVLPGGSPAAAALHVCRTVCRRAERVGVRLTEAEDESVSPAALKYLNRLSDLLFVAARFANAKGAADVLWRPGATR